MVDQIQGALQPAEVAATDPVEAVAIWIKTKVPHARTLSQSLDGPCVFEIALGPVNKMLRALLVNEHWRFVSDR